GRACLLDRLVVSNNTKLSIRLGNLLISSFYPLLKVFHRSLANVITLRIA
ncbi:MAG: hypothetical protein ACI9LA_000184, partial [Bacteroidia bacterium]